MNMIDAGRLRGLENSRSASLWSSDGHFAKNAAVIPENRASMQITTGDDACKALASAWTTIIDECRAVLGGELHYQAMVYHALRTAGVPLRQVGMNVKQMIRDPRTEVFQALMGTRHEDYRAGVEPIPDVVLFNEGVGGDWRRRNAEATLKAMLLAIEIKASERDRRRLTFAEISWDIRKMAAQREEVSVRYGHRFIPVMMVIDVAPQENERMRRHDMTRCCDLASDLEVDWYYVGPKEETRPRRWHYPVVGDA
ncbi:hypothetical protein [Paracoccus fontiphilus]|uniref:Uncharacterized protein n=2 Tax=Paracoccus fontiphilus TaxID=1815556 RepID=A0ABV7I8I4_9RHOB